MRQVGLHQESGGLQLYGLFGKAEDEERICSSGTIYSQDSGFFDIEAGLEAAKDHIGVCLRGISICSVLMSILYRSKSLGS